MTMRGCASQAFFYCHYTYGGYDHGYDHDYKYTGLYLLETRLILVGLGAVDLRDPYSYKPVVVISIIMVAVMVNLCIQHGTSSVNLREGLVQCGTRTVQHSES